MMPNHLSKICFRVSKKMVVVIVVWTHFRKWSEVETLKPNAVGTHR